MKPRVLCLMQLPPPLHGAAVVNQHVANSHLLGERFALEVLPLRFADSVADIGRASPKKLVRAAATAVRLVGALVRQRPDAVYFTLSPVGGAFYRDCAYIAVMKAFGIRRVYHLHGKGIARKLDKPWRRALYAWAFRDAWVIHLSPAIAADANGLVPPEHQLFVANGVEDAGEPPVRPAGARLRVLYLSAMAEAKGVLVLVAALGQLAARGVEFEATFAGPGFGDGCVEAFDAEIARLGLADRVRYVGPTYGDAKEALWREHDVLAFPTHYGPEAFPLVLLEAMAHRLPVVTTPEGAIPDIVTEGVTGFLVPQRDPAALAARLATLATDPARRVAMGEAARRRYLERFTLGAFERGMAEALAHCIG